MIPLVPFLQKIVIPPWVKWAAIAVAAVVCFGAGWTAQGWRADAKLAKVNHSIDKQKQDAADLLIKETARANAAEKALQDAKNAQEVKDVQAQKTVNALQSRLAALTVDGRLRDPNAGRGGGSGGPQGSTPSATGNSPDRGTEAAGLLSAELTGLLQRLQREADEINNAYLSCRADAFAVREKTK